MKKLESLANNMIYEDIVKRISEDRNIDLSKARKVVSDMSFKEYFIEATVPAPSGNTIGPTGSTANPTSSGTQASGGLPSGAKGVWVKGVPPQSGMVVSVKGRTGMPTQGVIKSVDTGRKGVIVKNTETNQEEMMNIDTLEPWMAGNKPGTPPPAGTPGNQTAQSSAMSQVGQVAEDKDLSRMLQLAGIKENCSGGATGAGAIAMAPTPMGKVKRREPTEEALTPEYTPKEPAKTIIGDTKPNQATGKLSADLAATGKKAAGRINNGRKRVR